MRAAFTALFLTVLCQATLLAQEHEEAASHGRHDDLYNGHGHGFEHIGPYEAHGRGEGRSHGHSGHTSIEGYPFVHGIRTEIDFIERALELDLVRIEGADGGAVDELEFDTELVWAVNDHMIFIVGAPLIGLDPIAEPNTTGMGDLELGVQFLAFGGRRSLLFFALNLTAPTGDPNRDLGAGRTTLEPTALWLYDFGKGNYLQSRLGWETPVSTLDVGSVFRYDFGLYHTCVASKHWPVFRFLTPLIEVNGITALNELGHGRTVLDLTTGVRWLVREVDEVGFGWSFPLTGSENFTHQFLLSYRLHF